MQWLNALTSCTETTATATACFGENDFAVADGKVIAAGPMETMLASEHPWLKAYFHGKRARLAEPSRK